MRINDKISANSCYYQLSALKCQYVVMFLFQTTTNRSCPITVQIPPVAMVWSSNTPVCNHIPTAQENLSVPDSQPPLL